MSANGEARAVRAVARARRRGRVAVWGTILLFIALYGIYGLAAAMEYDSVTHDGIDPEFAGLSGHWSALCMAVVPAWASLVVLLSCALAFPAERAAGTLDALRLTPLPTCALARALVRPRLRFGLVVLLVGLPLYLAPHGVHALSGELLEPWCVGHTALISTFGRVYIPLGVSRFHSSFPSLSPYFSPPPGLLARSLLSGLPAFIVDAARLYAMAAIGTAVSMRARSAARAVSWSVVWALVFLAVTVGAEWLGVLAVLPLGSGRVGEACLILAASALVLEAGVGNILAPWLVLRYAARRAERWLAQAG